MNSSTKIALIIVFVASVISGCIPVKVESEKDSNFQDKISSIVLLHDKEVPGSFLGMKGKIEKIVDLIKSDLESRSIQTALVVKETTTMNVNNKITNQMRAIGTDYVLLIRTPRVTTSYYANSFTLKVSIYDAKNKQEVWKSSTKFTFEHSSTENAAESIVQKMYTDGVI